MSWIKVVDESEAEGDLAVLYGRMLDPEFNRVDHIMTIHSLHPAGLRTHFDLYRAVMMGTAGLPKVDRELIALVVSQVNACHY